jgi:hypothetical protein
VDHERLGLKRIIIIADFADLYRRYSQAILAAMSDLCYVVSFTRTLPLGEFVVNVSAPPAVSGEIEQFFLRLQDKGMFTTLKILPFSWIRLVPMRAESYDFDSGRWEFDWSNPSAHGFEAAKHVPSVPAKFDYIDLLIVKELQMDATKSLKEISENLKLNYKKLAWHYSAHVRARNLIRGFYINWMGTRYDYKIDRALHRKHRYFAIQLLVRDVSDFELISLRQATNKLPFLWSEAVGKNYFAEFAFPTEFTVEGLQYLSKAVEEVRSRSVLFTNDQTASGGFTIPYTLFDEARKKWTLDAVGLNERFDNLIVQIKKGSA